LPPLEAIRRLREGNQRFLERGITSGARDFQAGLANRPQRPFAVILGCSDSRTPVEILFDEGFGDLFVVRIAGNVVAPSVVGSIEFAVSQFGTRLVVVLGHTKCGAVGATVEALLSGDSPVSRNIRSITDRISPHLEGVVRAANFATDTSLRNELTRINVRASADHLRHGSRILEDLALSGRVLIVGAEYDLQTGVVDFFDGVPSEASEPR